jgi:hypothetical protein
MALMQIDPASPLRMPPPPAPPLTVVEEQTLRGWLIAGMPLACPEKSGGGGDGGAAGDNGDAGSKPAPGGADAGTVPAVCTSHQQAKGTGPRMRPGDDCTRCHGFVISGTVFPTAHEPSGCYGSAGVQVLITDSNNMLFSFTANAAGSFFGDPFPRPAYPLHVKVVQGGKERQMLTPAPRGDCNTCHTQYGANAAPGRIMAP